MPLCLTCHFVKIFVDPKNVHDDSPRERAFYNALALYYEVVREVCVQILLHRAQEADNGDQPLEQLSLAVLSAAQNTCTVLLSGGSIGIPNRGRGFFDIIQSFGLRPLPEVIREDFVARRDA
jgi:hypothetical protein